MARREGRVRPLGLRAWRRTPPGIAEDGVLGGGAGSARRRPVVPAGPRRQQRRMKTAAGPRMPCRPRRGAQRVKEDGHLAHPHFRGDP
jgi:hypothetical protein